MDDIDWDNVDFASPTGNPEKEVKEVKKVEEVKEVKEVKEDKEGNNGLDDLGDLDDDLSTPDMSSLDNVEVEIPAKTDIPPRETPTKQSNLTKKEEEIMKTLAADDDEDLSDMMSDRKKLMKRLNEDPEFDKRFKKAELAYVAKIRGDKPPVDDTPNDKMYREAQAIVERIHNKSSSTERKKKQEQLEQIEQVETEEMDPYGLARFGNVTDEVPEDSEINLGDLIKLGKNGQGKLPTIYIANVKNLIINLGK